LNDSGLLIFQPVKSLALKRLVHPGSALGTCSAAANSRQERKRPFSMCNLQNKRNDHGRRRAWTHKLDLLSRVASLIEVAPTISEWPQPNLSTTVIGTGPASSSATSMRNRCPSGATA